jgi:hypothetical protein
MEERKSSFVALVACACWFRFGVFARRGLGGWVGDVECLGWSVSLR